ncbi:MAG: type VI secretion system-associated protein TagF [Rhodocyclaceae bacterium]|nr:type VI secretion system-associated protein TagF [Rhodocyclaceae bacterium]
MSWPQVNDTGLSGAVGFFGKIPAVGDFVHRRLPDDFLSAWDHWLQHMVVSSRDALGESWLESYVVAPFWRFVVVPGVVGSKGWMGVVMPSVDRVGRYFPFTLATPLPGNVNFIETFIAAHNWFESLEDLGAAALHPQLDMADWDVRLSSMPMPPLVLAGMEDDATVPLFTGARGPVAIPLPREDAAMAVSLVGALAGFRRPFSLFSAVAHEREGRIVLAMEGLPDTPRCHALLDGRWSANGWELQGGPEASHALIPPQAAAPAAVAEPVAAPVEVAAPETSAETALPAATTAAPDVRSAAPAHADDTLPLPAELAVPTENT